MVQGQAKKAKAPSAAKGSQRKQTGARVIKPKKAALQKTQARQKKLSSGLTERTERSLADKAGHLELVKGGKKEKKAEAALQKGG